MKYYQVTIYNQHAQCSHTAKAITKRKAFAKALDLAGPEFIGYGEDKSGKDHYQTASALFAQCSKDMGRAWSIYQNSHAGIGLSIALT